jgi:hypothetical protein
MGSIYVHLDWHLIHFVRTILDDVFGENNFVNEVSDLRQSRRLEKGGTAQSGLML